MPAQRILIIKHGALGDVVLAMGTMKRLRELHPEAHITLMTMGMFVPMAEQLGCLTILLWIIACLTGSWAPPGEPSVPL